MDNKPLLRANEALAKLKISKFADRDTDKTLFFVLYKSLEDF